MASKDNQPGDKPDRARKAPSMVILIVDDNPDDALLAERTIANLQAAHPVRVVHGGKDVLSYMEGAGDYGDREKFPIPGLILLDLRMPGMDGFEVLKWLQANPEHKSVPVVVLTGYGEYRSLSEAYRLGARSFLSKPLQALDFQNLLQSLKP